MQQGARLIAVSGLGPKEPAAFAVRVIAPVGYLDMMALLDACNRVLTDSGGCRRRPIFSKALRDPARHHRVDRNHRERLEPLGIGPDYRPRRDIAAYGDGRAAEKIVAIPAAEI
jgi:UDP-GlcNAc3NAcA epimerase